MNTPIKTSTRKAGKQRVTVQLWTRVAQVIAKDFKALHIKRDAYLNDLFTREIEELAYEVAFRNSDEVRKRLRDRPIPDRIPINLDLDTTLVVRMDEVLKARNIPRDSFVNRVLFFLIAKEVHLDHLGVDYDKDSPATAKPLSDAKGFLLNPFFHIRSKNAGAFYAMPWFSDAPFGKNGPNLFGLNTAISDSAWELMTYDGDDMLGDLGMLPSPGDSHATN